MKMTKRAVRILRDPLAARILLLAFMGIAALVALGVYMIISASERSTALEFWLMGISALLGAVVGWGAQRFNRWSEKHLDEHKEVRYIAKC